MEIWKHIWRIGACCSLCLGAGACGDELDGEVMGHELAVADQDRELGGARSLASTASRPLDDATEPASDGCFSGYRPPVAVEWADRGDALPELAVDFNAEFGPADRVELQFYLEPVPARGSAVLAAGEPLRLRGDASVGMPAALLAAVRGGGKYVASAIVRACAADDPHGNCDVRHSGELQIEDGQAFLPGAFQVHLREKWGGTKPWLFQGVVVTDVVEMKGQ